MEGGDLKWALRPNAGFMNESVYPHKKPPMWVTIVGVVGCFEWYKKKKKLNAAVMWLLLFACVVLQNILGGD